MAQALVDYVIGETLGQAAFMDNCLVDRVAIEVLGYFQFGTVDMDHVIAEVLGVAVDTNYTVIAHVVGEVMGQWPGF